MLELQPTLILAKREGAVSCFEWSPDGAWVAEARPEKGGIRLWSVSGAEPVAGPIAAVPGIVVTPSSWGSLRWSPDGRRLSISAAELVRVFDVDDDGALTQRWASSCAPKARAPAAWRPDGGALAIGVGDRVILLDAETGEHVFDHSLALPRSAFVTTLEWNPERTTEVAVGASHGMFGVDVEARAITIDVGVGMVSRARWWARDLVYLASDRQVIAWNPRRGEAAGHVTLDDFITTLSLSADRTLAAAMVRGRLVLLRTPHPRYGPEPATLEVVADVTLAGVKRPTGAWAEFHPSAPQLAVHTGNGNGIQIYTWDPAQLAA